MPAARIGLHRRCGPGLLLALTLHTAGCQPARPPEPVRVEPAVEENRHADTARAELPGTSRPPSVEERVILHRLMNAASSVRGLPFLREVPAEIQDATRIRAFVAADIDPAELRDARELYGTLGLLPANVDLEALLLELLGEQIVGYYDPEGQRLVIRDDVIRSLAQNAIDEARVVLVHELVHALQDQHLRLGALSDLERDSDAENAYRALVEGDATLAMVAYVLESQGTRLGDMTANPQVLQRFFQNGVATSGGALDRAPAILRVPLTAPYTGGALFCGDRHRVGGWRSVDSAHGLPPISTEQVLHPEKYQAGELPDAVPGRREGAMEAEGFVRALEDTLGELELSIYFAQGTSSDQDLVAAAGWSGDRVAIYSHADAPSAAVWWTAWDTEADAREAEQAALRVGRPVEGSAVVRHGRAVLILRHVPAVAAAALTANFADFARNLPTAPPHR